MEEGYVCLSDSVKEKVKSYAEEQGKNWGDPSAMYKLLANFIVQDEGSQPTSRPGPSGR